jgi:hypothetical protein
MQTVMQTARLGAARGRIPSMMKLALAICPLVLLPALVLAPVGCGISKPAALVGTGGETMVGSGGAGGSGGAMGGGGAGDSAGPGGRGVEPASGGASGVAGAGDTGGADDTGGAGGGGDTGGTSGGGVATAGLQYNGVIRFFRGAP